MQDSQNLAGGSGFSSEALLLWLAVVLAVVFLGLLAFDFIKRRKRLRHRRRGHESSGAKVLKLVNRARAFQHDLKRMLHERARRKQRETPP